MPTFAFMSLELYDEYLLQVMNGASSAARQLNCNFVNLISYGHEAFFRIASERRFDGLIFPSHYLSWNRSPEQLREFIQSFDVPAVALGLAVPGTPSIVVDNVSGFYQQIEHLIKVHGYRRLAYLDGPKWNSEAQVRRATYLRVLADNGLPCEEDLIYEGYWGYGEGERMIGAMFESRRIRPDAIVASNDQLAGAAIHALDARGFKVPADFAVVGFDDSTESRHLSPPLTTVRQPIYDLGATAVKLLKDLHEGRPIPLLNTLETVFIVRQSCGCLPVDVKDAAATWQFKNASTQKLEHARAGVLRDTMALFDLAESDRILKWTNELFDAFSFNMGSETSHDFINVLDQMARDNAGADRDLLIWQALISLIRRHVLPVLAEREQILRAENLFHQGRVIVAGATALSIVMKSRRTGTYVWKLLEDNEMLSAIHELDLFVELFNKTLKKSGVKRCMIALARGGHFTGEVDLLFDFDPAGESGKPKAPRAFDITELMPADILPDGFNIFLQPLIGRGGLLGYVALEMESFFPQVVLDVRRQCSMSLNNIFMVQEIREQNHKLATEIKARQKMEQELEFRAFHDTLTKLPNRALFLDRLGQAEAMLERNGDFKFAVLFIDLDGFKQHNDSLGHEAGDELLIAVSGRLHRCVRGLDTLARLGGDEFTILLFDIHSRDDAARVAQRVLDEVSAPFNLKGNTAQISASIGIAVNDSNSPLDRILQNADLAMYRAKHAGKSRFAFFAPGPGAH